MNNIFPPINPTSIVYVVIEITDPNMCFGINQKQYIKYDERKQLSIIGTYEDRSIAEVECAKGHGRYILSSEFHRSIFPKPITLPDPSRPFGFPESTLPFRFSEPPSPHGFSDSSRQYGLRNENTTDMDIE